jgi:hypothetical protein
LENICGLQKKLTREEHKMSRNSGFSLDLSDPKTMMYVLIAIGILLLIIIVKSTIGRLASGIIGAIP